MKSLYGWGVLLIAGLIVTQVKEGAAYEDHTEWVVSALCEPHSEVVNPHEVKVRMAFSSTVTGPTATAWLSSMGKESYETSTPVAFWERPSKGWVSFVFAGLPMSAAYYCQTDWGPKPLRLAYQPTDKIRLFLSRDGKPSSVELNTVPTDNRSTLQLSPVPGNNVYAAGGGSINAYWLEVAIPVYNTPSSSTVLFNEFQ